ncbi:O-methyltransferase [Pedobacter cryophilus]|uniref:Methyltransferase domain-containing protein n=1 Tax=Pedobacter cryophilus TaxID=2571271 RepID=A0A4U1C3E4_9SPHI|nr:hypothetical protein [Pedobacter cryophilus]TKB98629.1 hypothetical protein FA046_05795 [Pedobacter cryophilus]
MLNKIKSFWHLPVRLEEQRQKTIQAYSLNILHSYFKNLPAFPMTTWSMSPTALLHLMNYILIYKPKRILEFGAGSSTIFINQLIKEKALDCKLICIEQDLKWLKIIKETVQTHDVTEFHQVDLSESLNFNSHNFKWFNFKSLDFVLKNEPLDLVIIDAPIAYNNPYCRAGAFIYLQDKIMNDSLNYFLDDANRIGEKTIAKNLGKNNQWGLDYVLGGKPLIYDCTPITYKK